MIQSFSQQIRSELPVQALVGAVVEACREAVAASENTFQTEESIRDAVGYMRKALLNEKLQQLDEAHEDLSARQERNSGMLHHAHIESASFVVTPKLLAEPNGSLPKADYRQSLALEMPLYPKLAQDQDEDEKSYFVLVYSVDPHEPSTPSWVALRDPGGQCVIDLSAELEAALEAENDLDDSDLVPESVEEVNVEAPMPTLRATKSAKAN